MNALDYLLKANLYGLLFAGCYWLLLRRHTFLGLNRAYLLLSVMLSLALPLVSLPTQTVETLPNLDWPVPVGVITLPVSTVVTGPIVSEPYWTVPDWEQLGLWGYGLVALVLFVRLAVRVGRLVRLIRQSPRRVQEGYILVQPNDPTIPTFSFFRYVILNPTDTRNNLILQHELVHVRQYHSADVLGMEVVQAVFWACPTLWLIDRMLRQVHEFLADKPASQATEYAQFLVHYSFGMNPGLTEAEPLTNSFFKPSLLKQRIQMLHQRATTRWAFGKYALVIPLAFGLLAMTTARKEMVEMVGQATGEPTTSDRDIRTTDDKPLSGGVVITRGKDVLNEARKKVAALITQSTDTTITISGRVTSAVDGKPLAGAAVVLKGKWQAMNTDADGTYKLTNVPRDELLVVSFVGFKTQEVKVNGRTAIDVSMSLQTSKLNEVVVVAYEPATEPIAPIQSTTAKPISQTSSTGEVFTVVEQQPEFPGGMRALGQYLARNLRYPREAQQNRIQGRVFVQFVVSQTGETRNLRVLKGIGGGCDEEAVRVISQMPKWNPGKQQGKAVDVLYNLPIQFALEKPNDKRTGQVPGSQPDSSKKTGFIIDNSKNGRFALYNDVMEGSKERYTMPLPDSLKSSGPFIQIRGNALSGGEPLYILDGVELTKADTNKLNPHTIESISVLKGSASAAYGPKARYGVVLITTKKK